MQSPCWYSTSSSSSSSSGSSSSGGNSSSADLDRIQHGYDRASNRLWRKNTVADAAGVYLDELYSYDGLYRLAELQRGQLNSSNNGIVSGTLNFAQAWGLDATGNWGQFWEDDSGSTWNLQQSRTASVSNEITAITGGGWAAPAYDAAGNMVQFPPAATPTSAFSATYDAWDRLASISSGGSVIQRNAYDGDDRRVTELTGSTLRHHYFTVDWQSLEERLGSSSSADRQFVWGRRYIDDLVLRDRGVERLYAFQDPNWNVTGICTASGAGAERYAYTAYGEPIWMNADFARTGTSTYGLEVLFGGYRFDGETMVYNVRNRFLHFFLGRWLTPDPVSQSVPASAFSALGRPGAVVRPWVVTERWRRDTARDYVYVMDSPIDAIDPAGLFPVCCTFDNGSDIWSETIDCQGHAASSFAVASKACCTEAATGAFSSWTVLGARCGRCRPPDPGCLKKCSDRQNACKKRGAFLCGVLVYRWCGPRWGLFARCQRILITCLEVYNAACEADWGASCRKKC